MTGHAAMYPSWGVLVEASLERVTELLEPLRLRFDFHNFVVRTADSWTAVFNMEPGDTADDEAAELLRLLGGFVPVYRFDFSKYEYLTFRWDGEAWIQDRDPAYVLGERALEIPGEIEGVSNPRATLATASRTVSVIEGVTIDDARDLALDLDEELHMDSGPVGAIVYEPDLATQMRLWLAPQRVFEVVFYPRPGTFRIRIIRGATCLGTFRPGETRSLDGTPFLSDIDGETMPERIIDRLGIDRSFVERSETTP